MTAVETQPEPEPKAFEPIDDPERLTQNNLKNPKPSKQKVAPMTYAPEPVIAEILEVASLLRPRAFFGRIDYWRSGAGGSSWGEFVTGSSEPSIPVTQPTDSQGRATGPPMVKDKTDRELQKAKREFRDDLDDVRRLLGHAHALQVKYLFDVHEGTADLNDLVTDSPVCRRCKGTKEMWVRDRHKSPWRIKAGLGPCCYATWVNQGRPDLPPADAKTMEEAAG